MSKRHYTVLLGELLDHESGQTSRQVTESLNLGKSTVLKILKGSGVTVRPQWRRY